MKNIKNQALGLVFGIWALNASAQVQWNSLGDYRLHPTIPATGPRSLTIGPNYSGAGDPALNVRADQFSAGNLTGEVFRTVAPAANSTYWRMYSGGDLAGNERGQLFGLTGQNHFNVNAPNGHLRLYTNTVERMRLNEGSSTSTIGFFSNVNTSGFVGLSPDNTLWSLGAGTPFSRLHLHNGSVWAQNQMYRPWMQNGITLSGNYDHAYIGQLYNGFEQSDLVFTWGNDMSGPPYGPDRMRWIFTSNYSTIPTYDSEGLLGLEAMRLYVPDGDQANLGVGNFVTAATEPLDRVHLVTGRLRISELPEPQHAAPNGVSKLLVVDDVTPLDHGVVKWLDISAISDCDWQAQPGNDISTAYIGNTCPPIEANNVGIGVQDPSAKLDVLKEVVEGNGLPEVGIRSAIRINEGVKRSIDALNVSEGDDNTGLLAWADNARDNWGIRSLAGRGDEDGLVVAGYFEADGETMPATPVGVWSRVVNMAPGYAWAGFFEGKGYISGGPWQYPSDQQLKVNIEDIPKAEALERVLQLQPKTYEYDVEGHPSLALNPGPQMGFLAQDVEAIYPELVSDVTRPAITDPDGNTVEEATTLKAMSYEGLVPELTAALQREHELVLELSAQLTALAQQVSACCSGADADKRKGGIGHGPVTGSDSDLRIIPNPVADETELRYTVSMEGRVRLEITDASGRMIQTQDEGLRGTGTFSYGWDTTALSAGTYFCTLYVNDEPLVKKAVKLNAR